jgi:hypothetical protein
MCSCPFSILLCVRTLLCLKLPPMYLFILACKEATQRLGGLATWGGMSFRCLSSLSGLMSCFSYFILTYAAVHRMFGAADAIHTRIFIC